MVSTEELVLWNIIGVACPHLLPHPTSTLWELFYFSLGLFLLKPNWLKTIYLNYSCGILPSNVSPSPMLPNYWHCACLAEKSKEAFPFVFLWWDKMLSWLTHYDSLEVFTSYSLGICKLRHSFWLFQLHPDLICLL